MELTRMMQLWYQKFCTYICDDKEREACSMLTEIPLVEMPENFKSALLATVALASDSELMCDALRFIIRSGGDVNFQTRDGNPILKSVIRLNNINKARILVDCGATCVNEYYSNGNGPLHVAVGENHYEMVVMLLEKSYDVNCVNDSGMTALHYAVYCNSAGIEKTVQTLINAGANVNARCHRGNTPLHYALKDSLIELLLENGADVNAASHTGDTPLYIAVDTDNFPGVKRLVEAGSNVNYLDVYGRSVLHYACVIFRWYIIKYLLYNGALPNLLDQDGLDPLAYGLKDFSLQLENDVSVDYDERFENCELPWVSNIMNTMKLLFRHGAKVNRSNLKVSPLYVALSFCPYSKFVTYLLCRGAVFDFDDETVRNIMTTSKFRKAACSLISHAAIYPNFNRPRNFEFNELNDEQKIYFCECSKEINSMKNKRIGDTNVTLYDILAERNIARFARDFNVTNFFDQQAIEAYFPIYGNRLTERFLDEKYVQDLLTKASNGLSIISGENPYSMQIIFRRIIDYLNEDDMSELSKL